MWDSLRTSLLCSRGPAHPGEPRTLIRAVPLPHNKHKPYRVQGRKPGMIWIDNDVEREREDEDWRRRRREGLGLTAESPETGVPTDD